MTSNPWIHVAMTPAEAVGDDAECAVVIDALRATTTIVAFLDAGARSVTAALDIELARALATEKGALLAGEVDGLPPAGFDFGNSPVEVAAAHPGGRDIVLFTTNGTKALCSVSASVVVAAALTNVTAVAEFALRHATVSIVCAGNHGGTRFAMEDFAVAGALVTLLRPGTDRVLNDPAKLGQACVAGGTESVFARAAQLMAESEHAAKTRDLGLGRDIEYACRADISHALPVVVETGEGWVRLEDQRHLRGLDVFAEAIPT